MKPRRAMPLLAWMLTAMLSAQESVITVKVFDNNGNPLSQGSVQPSSAKTGDGQQVPIVNGVAQVKVSSAIFDLWINSPGFAAHPLTRLSSKEQAQNLAVQLEPASAPKVYAMSPVEWRQYLLLTQRLARQNPEFDFNALKLPNQDAVAKVVEEMKKDAGKAGNSKSADSGATKVIKDIVRYTFETMPNKGGGAIEAPKKAPKL